MRSQATAALTFALLVAGCQSSDPQADSGEEGLGENVIGFYQQHVGEQWGFHCDFQPSCSEYGRQAVNQYGLVAGGMMIFDRLLRDQGQEGWIYAHTADGRPIDPVEDNALFEPKAEAEATADFLAWQEADEQEARAVPPADPDGLFAFAHRLYENGEFGRAGVEYRRFRFLFPGDARDSQVVRRLALCLSRQGRHDEALALSQDLGADERLSFQALLLRDAGRLDEGLFLVQQQEAADPLLLGMLELESGRTEAARRSFTDLDGNTRGLMLDRISTYEELPHRSPRWAGVMSAVLPGSGQLYSGRRGDGLTAFFTNAVLIGGTASALHNDENVTAVALGFFAVGFYTGNIYGGVNAAHRFNRRQREEFLQETRGALRQRSWDLGLTPGPDGGALSLYLRF